MAVRVRINSYPTVKKSWQYTTESYQAYQCGNPWHNFPTTYSGVLEVQQGSRSMTDVVIPNFRKLSAQGRIFNNPMTKVSIVKDESIGSLYQDSTYFMNGYWCIPPSPLVVGARIIGTRPASAWIWDDPEAERYALTPSLNGTELANIALTNAWANVDASKTMALVMIAEAEKTVRSVVDIFKRSFKIFRAIRRLDLKALAGEIKPRELSQRYMECRYSLRPLYYDMMSSVEAWNAKKEKVDRFTFRGKREASANSTGSYTGNSQDGDRVTVSVKCTRTIAARAGVLTTIDAPSSWNLWGFDSIAQSAWELVPLSFVVDWFLNVGQTIASWSPEAGVKSLASWYTIEDVVYRKHWVSSVLLYDGGKPYINRRCDIIGAEKTFTQITKTRVPDPYRNIFPRVDLKLNVLKLLDLLIILKQIFKK